MTASTTNWRISPAAWVPIAIAVVAEATSNALRAYGLGTHLEAFTLSANSDNGECYYRRGRRYCE